MNRFTDADDEPLWDLIMTTPPGAADPIDKLVTELLDIQDDIAAAVIWIAENWSADLPAITWDAGNPFKGHAVRLMVSASSHSELNRLARLLDVPALATRAYHNKVWWHAERAFGAVLFDVFYGEPIPADTAGYVANYLDKANRPNTGAA